jgi:sortase A
VPTPRLVAMTEPAAESTRAPMRPRNRVSVVGVLGELLITAGVLVLLFLGWQLWLNDIIMGNEANQEAVQQTREWDHVVRAPVETAPDEPPVATAPANGQRFGLVVIPRFGADYYRPIAQGVGTKAVLNKAQFGHYPSTQMPGAVGNFAIAAHRTTYGAPLGQIAELRVGDHIYIETPDGWYQYDFRNLEYVRPTGVGVLDPVPQSAGTNPGDRILTMTSCNPKLSAAERIIAYSVFDRFYPRDASKPASGAPDEIATTVAGGAA